MAIEKIKRSAIAHFLDTSKAADYADAAWKRVGKNVDSASTEYNPQTETEQDIISESATTELTGYQPTMPISQKCTKGDEVYEFVSTARIGQLEKRYGEKYGKLIAFRKVDTGMTREMVIAAWGEPYHKSEVKKEGRTLETLRFSDNRYVELLDGEVQYVRIY